MHNHKLKYILLNKVNYVNYILQGFRSGSRTAHWSYDPNPNTNPNPNPTLTLTLP